MAGWGRGLGSGRGVIFGKGKESEGEGKPRCFSSLSSLSLPFNWTCALRARGEVRWGEGRGGEGPDQKLGGMEW